MQDLYEKILNTDVLIIGAGGAGLRAAIAARNRNVGVLIVSKGSFPQECNTHVAGGGMLAVLNKKDSTEKYFQDTMRAGGWVNYPHLVSIMAEHSAQRAMDLEQYGLSYTRENGNILVWPTADCSVPRALPGGRPYSGDWFKSLADEAGRLGIPVMEKVAVSELIKDKDAVIGAVAIDMKTGALVTIHAKSIILACGGAGGIYSFTTNVPGITGDGLMMAYRAGASLSHLEFMQMRQCIIHPKGLYGMLPPFDGFVSAGGRFFNGIYERYMKRYHPKKAEAVTRAEIAKCAQLEIMAGRQSPHGGVFGDLSDVDRATIKSMKKFMDACTAANFDPTFQCYEWGPASHHFMGGVVINESCETGVPGLYAAGEVAAGVQGANRMGGNALTETQVFGAIAGEAAARRALAMDCPAAAVQAHAVKQVLIADVKRGSGVDHLEVRSEITQVMSRYVGVIRNEDGLRKAVELLETMETSNASELCLATDRGLNRLPELLETRNLLALGQLMVKAALLRTESRGAHQREDFPETDQGWEKNLVLRLTAKGSDVTYLPVASVLE